MNPSPQAPSAPPGYHPVTHAGAAHSPWNVHGYPNFLASPTPHQYYPYPATPPGYPPMPWGYPHMSQGPQPHTPGPHHNHNDITRTAAIGLGGISTPAAQPASTSSLEDWCNKHNLGNEERLGLIKLGFRVGDKNLVTLPAPEWEWAGLGPLHKQRILAAYNAEHV